MLNRRLNPVIAGQLGLSLLVALAICFVTLVFFSPRIGVWWAWWRVPRFFYGPELGRARSALWQVNHLGERIPDPIHSIIRWRLLFPGLSRLLHLPVWMHLALYPLGCLCTIMAVVYALQRRGASVNLLILGGAAIAANAWFFTS